MVEIVTAVVVEEAGARAVVVHMAMDMALVWMRIYICCCQ